MNDSIVIKRTALIAFMVAVESLVPPLVAVGSLFAVARLWHLSFARSPATPAVMVTLLFVMLMRPPRDLGSRLDLQPAAGGAGTLLRWLLALAVLMVIGHYTGVTAEYPPGALYVWALVTPALLIASTLPVQQLMRWAALSAVRSRKAIVAGYNASAQTLAHSLSRNHALKLEVEGFFDDRSTDRLKLEPDARLLGRLSDLTTFAKAHGTDVIFIALPIRQLQRVLDVLDDLRDTTVSIYYVPDVFIFDPMQVRPINLNGIPVIAMCETPFYGYRGVTKRMFDVCVSALLLVGLAPLLLAIALLIKLSSAGPALFRQRRYGLDGREIVVYKFRTMTVTEDGAQVRQASRTDCRVTPVGAFLRRYSLDELPQLINVLQGRMSLVGPRPHAVAHNEQYRKLIKGYMLRHKVLPGMTGLAQINGARGETSRLEDMQARIRYDLDYLGHWSPMLDLKILMMTAVRLFGDERAY